MYPDGIRTEIRRNPLNGDITIHLIGLKGPLIDSQIGTEGKEIDVFPKIPSDDGVQVRVISPPVPLLTLEAEPVGGIDEILVYDREPSFGVDERLEPNRLNQRGLEMLLGGFAYRTGELRHDERFQNNLRLFYPYVIYKPSNHMSDEKLIGRLLAARVIAPAIKDEIRSAREYFEFREDLPFNERCMYCDIVQDEIKKAGAKMSRVVALTRHFVGIVSFSSSGVYSVNFIPRRHAPRFSELTQEEIADLTTPLYSEIQKMTSAASGNVRFDAINVAVHSLPFYSANDPTFWRGISEACHTYIEMSPGIFPINRKENYGIPGSRMYVSKVRPKDIGRELRIGVHV